MYFVLSRHACAFCTYKDHVCRLKSKSVRAERVVAANLMSHRLHLGVRMPAARELLRQVRQQGGTICHSIEPKVAAMHFSSDERKALGRLVGGHRRRVDEPLLDGHFDHVPRVVLHSQYTHVVGTRLSLRVFWIDADDVVARHIGSPAMTLVRGELMSVEGGKRRKGDG